MTVNRIKEIAEEKGIRDLSPTEHVLKELKIHIHTWNRWWSKKKDPELWQLPVIAEFLHCEVSELLPTNK